MDVLGNWFSAYHSRIEWRVWQGGGWVCSLPQHTHTHSVLFYWINTENPKWRASLLSGMLGAVERCSRIWSCLPSSGSCFFPEAPASSDLHWANLHPPFRKSYSLATDGDLASELPLFPSSASSEVWVEIPSDAAGQSRVLLALLVLQNSLENSPLQIQPSSKSAHLCEWG